MVILGLENKRVVLLPGVTVVKEAGARVARELPMGITRRRLTWEVEGVVVQQMGKEEALLS